MRVTACKHVGSRHHPFKYIWCVYMLNQLESLCADLTDFCLISLFRVLALKNEIGHMRSHNITWDHMTLLEIT